MPGGNKRRPVGRLVRKTAPGGRRVTLAAQQAQSASKDLLVVEDSTLRMMLADPRFAQAVPCLAAGAKALQETGKKCGRCNRKRSAYLRNTYNQVRQCVAGLKGEQQSKLKQLLGVKKVRVMTAGGRNHVTF